MNRLLNPRPESRLKNLPERRQREIIATLRSSSYSAVRAQLAAEGLQTSETALKYFWQWWHAREAFLDMENQTHEAMKKHAAKNPGMPANDLGAWGRAFFQLLIVSRHKDGHPKQALTFLTSTPRIAEFAKVIVLERNA